MSKIPLVENSILEISIKVKINISDLEKASKIYYDTLEEKLVDSQGRVWSPLMMLENIEEGEYEILTSIEDFEEGLGLTVEEYSEIEVSEPYAD